ncbi:DNA-directed RNA polymerase III largest subunit, putative [Trypanosoma cruzi]|uniref:DNA-directed RNA polymerase subunit n=1 Tax=Trypanosoma cruzi (strain CL Brener) TaxID=353153 RepID=Q4DZA9_TRYCC|nr:DNA-directed RNA polymerase III largest subunit, putative [Trypanosoma cruzi]EAN97840.1 DNA-directed RNA polymerase III largest subunit, putative [Trypanosoma cruzi]|eukprot:XP_819691.1 DNA-directed RNA polymerase III largest subunit [Trypanosoma cruzi strain CL Brener]
MPGEGAAAPLLLPQQFVEPLPNAPVEIRALHYGLLSRSDIHRLSVLPCRRVIGAVKEYGVNDPRLGVCDRVSFCATCGLRSIDCVGHPGHIDLETPVFHLGFFTTILRICRTICKRCSHLLLDDAEIEYYKRRLSSTKLEPLQRAALVKTIQREAYKTRVCLKCGGLNGDVRRVRPLRLVHEKYRVEPRRGEESVEGVETFFDYELRAACAYNKVVEESKENVHEFLDPARVRQMFLAVPPDEVLLLGLLPGTSPVDLLVTTLLVPPVSVRPRGSSGTANIRDDDLTGQYNDILISSDTLQDGSIDASKYTETWEMLQMRAARLIDSALPGFPPHMRTADVKSYAQRLKGKHGRFRGNLSGKRVDFSGRSVISPDPNLDVDELAVPLRVARVLTYPQRVFKSNLELMRRLVRNGPNVHPGAVAVYLAQEGSKKSLNHERDRESLSARLSIGDVVERHVMNGDVVLFNRQPSLHRISMMAHRARVLPFRTFRFNECCCAPYNADFDGDEMNVHLVQTEEARAEAFELMLTAKNIINAKNGEPIIACTQDFLVAAYLVTSRDVFFDRSQMSWMVSHWLGPVTQFRLPIPTILKPTELWTGKQVFELILRPSPEVNVLLNLEAATKFYTKKGRHDCAAEGYVAFLDSRFISGRLDKKLLGGGAKDGLFARLHTLSGGGYTARIMSRIAQFTSRYLTNYGFSLGLGDVAPTPLLNEQKAAVLARSFATCDSLIESAKTGRMEPLPGLTVRQSLEARLNAELSKVRDECGTAAVETLSVDTNTPLMMVQSGSKGSALNIAQMMACVGQQTVSGKRILNAFQDRSLPHFYRFEEAPSARGFVANSFYSGLTPTEFFFHTMAGREGLVDTAVKTAETGYIYRRLMKAMENLSVRYDGTARNTRGDVVQFRFGEDGLDPQLMEGVGGTPLNLDQEWLSARAAYARWIVERCNTLNDASRNDNHTDGSSRRDRRRNERDVKKTFDPDDDDEFISLLPTEVPAFVMACLSGDSGALEVCERLERLDEEKNVNVREMDGKSSDEGMRQQERTRRAGLISRLASVSSSKFKEDVANFFQKKVKEQKRIRALLEISSTSREGKSRKTLCNSLQTAHVEGNHAELRILEKLQTELLPLTYGMITRFLAQCASKYILKACEPGTPCGAIAAQSVGEPSTQMTLRTFHFAGVASMSITQGVPRLVEIINANRNIATPVVTAPVRRHRRGKSLSIKQEVVGESCEEDSQEEFEKRVRRVKSQVERVLLKEVASEIVEVCTSTEFYLRVHLNMSLIAKLWLPINAITVRQRILAAAARPMSPLRLLREECVEVVSLDTLAVRPYFLEAHRVHFNLRHVLALLPDVVVGGIAGINRAMISSNGAEVLAEGAELRAVMNLPEVESTRVVCNHVAVVERVLGIEAARQVIVNEIQGILKAYSLSIDIRHIYLLADLMTQRGVVLGITRYGIQKMNFNVLTMASFERTTDHLYNAAATQRVDENLSVSESIIIGKPVPLGTTSFSLLLDCCEAGARSLQFAGSRTRRGTGRSFHHVRRPRTLLLAAEDTFHLDLF